MRQQELLSPTENTVSEVPETQYSCLQFHDFLTSHNATMSHICIMNAYIQSRSNIN